MKTSVVLFITIVFAVACSAPKKTPAKTEAPKVSRSDMLKGGTSFSAPVVIMVQDEKTGLEEEYKWLSINYPGYSLIRRTEVSRPPKHFDVVRIKTKQGQLKDIHFDSTRFSGKN